MPFIVIKNHPVFISLQREQFLLDEIMKKPSEKTSALISGLGRSNFVEKVEHYLLELYNDNIDEFNEKWFHIILVEEIARTNLRELLLDYCTLNKSCRLERILSTDGGIDFYLTISKPKSIFDKLLNKRYSIAKVFIETKNIHKIQGDLTALFLSTKDYSIYLSEEIIIYPKDYFLPPNLF